MTSQLWQGFRLGDLEIDPVQGEVHAANGSRHMPPKAAEVLLCLAARPGEIVPREELLESVWGPGKGSEEALSQTVSALRQALGDHHLEPLYIQTLPRRGYRLLMTPELIHVEEPVKYTTDSAHSDEVTETGWLENLRERGVIQAGIAYAVFGWLLIQVADVVFDQLQVPRFGMFTTVLVIAGFPVVLVLSWFLEFRDGRAVPHELSPMARQRRRFSRTYLSVTGALAVAAVAVFYYDRNVGLPSAVDIPEFAPALPPVQANSFAVLPFKNVDGSEQTGVFADGLVDDVITRLSQVPGLRVASRGDSFMLEADTPSQRVRERLRVSRYLEGSVETAGDTIRVIVQLIDSESGFHVFSRRFDRDRANYFDLRDEITGLTVSTVRVSLPADAQGLSAPHGREPELDAYLLYRRGIDASRRPVNMENVAEAMRWFDAALEVDPEYAAAYAGKCATAVDAWTEVDDPAMIDRARASCASASRFNPNLAVVNAALGRLHLATGKLNDAEKAYEAALRSDPSNEDAQRGLGDVLQRQNRLAEAEVALRRNLDLHPGNAAAHMALGNFMFYTGRFDDAAQQYEFAVALDPDNMNGYTNLGAAQTLGGEFTEAIATLHRSLQIEPKQITWSNLGLLHYYLGDFDAALAAHDQAVALEPRDYAARSNRADALWAAGRVDEAQREYRRARELAAEVLQVDAQDPFLRINLAWIDAMLGDLAAARSGMEQARRLAPDDPYTHYIDGLVHLRSGEADDAIVAFRAAIELGYARQLLRADPHLRALKSDRRFAELLSGA